MMWHTVVLSCCIIIASSCPASNDPSPEPTTPEKSESEEIVPGGNASEENGSVENSSDDNESEETEPEPEIEVSTEEPKEPSYMLTGTQFHILFQGFQIT